MRWNGLFFKERKLMHGFISTAVVIALAACVLASIMPGFGIISTAVVLGYTIPPLFVLYSLNSEANQLDAFLHQPFPAWKLLLVKIGMGFLLGLVYVLITSAYLMVSSLLRLENGVDFVPLLKKMSVFSLSAWMVSLYPTVILVFLWTVYRIWRGRFGSIAMGLIIGLLILGNAIMNLFRKSYLYDVLTHWGEYTIQTRHVKGPTEFVQVAGTFYLGTYIVYGVLVIAYFWISCWMLDRKVGL